jgi:Zn-dependent M28 family amino/carboxypeptidase
MRSSVVALFFVCLGPIALAGQAPAPTVPPVNIRAIDAHLRYLADDELEGRAPATRGGRLAARYIAAQFQAYGLDPAGSDTSYFLPVALIGTTPRATLTLRAGSGGSSAATALRFGDDFVAWAERPDTLIKADAEVVFVGYGITAPESQWDDYKGMTLTGKILLMLVNDPGLQDSSLFRGKELTYYGRWTYKLEEAARRGAIGAIIVHTTESATYGWQVVKGSWTVEQFKLDPPRSPNLAFAAWITGDAASAALASRGLKLDSLTRAAARRDFKPVATGLQAAMTVTSTVRRVQSENVVGRLSGTDPGLRSEVVIFTAHYDHKGIGPAVDGDSIYNGAEDNASGVAAMLGVAEALGRVQPAQRSRRPILFIATTAEESGLLGSEAYVAHPVVPLGRTAAVINLDVTNVRGATRDIGALGGDRSTLGPLFAASARAEGLTPTGDADPSRGSFFRSDHFPFVRAGVPALSFQPGKNFVGRPANWGKEQDDLYNDKRYHQPKDEYARTFRYDGMVQQLKVAIRVALAVANSSTLPDWLQGSEFRRPR